MKELKAFDFGTAGRTGGYEWDKILDGKIHQLEEGEDGDYNCKQTTFATLVRNAAKKRGLGVHIKKVEGGTVVQAYAADGVVTEEEDGAGETDTPVEETPKPKKGGKK